MNRPEIESLIARLKESHCECREEEAGIYVHELGHPLIPFICRRCMEINKLENFLDLDVHVDELRRTNPIVSASMKRVDADSISREHALLGIIVALCASNAELMKQCLHLHEEMKFDPEISRQLREAGDVVHDMQSPGGGKRPKPTPHPDPRRETTQ